MTTRSNVPLISVVLAAGIVAAQAQADIMFPPISYTNQTRGVSAGAGAVPPPVPSISVNAADFGPFDAAVQSPSGWPPYGSAWAEQHSYLGAHTIEVSCLASTVDLDGPGFEVPGGVVYRFAASFFRVEFDLAEATINGSFFGVSNDFGNLYLSGPGVTLSHPGGGMGGAFSFTGITLPAGHYIFELDFERVPGRTVGRSLATAVLIVPSVPTFGPVACAGLLGAIRRRRPATA